jgi:hypothetical protein
MRSLCQMLGEARREPVCKIGGSALFQGLVEQMCKPDTSPA